MRTLTRDSVQGGASALGRRREEGEWHLANREFAFGTLSGVEYPRVYAAIATCPESDHHIAAESARSAPIIRIILLIGGRMNEDIKDLRNYIFLFFVTLNYRFIVDFIAILL